MPSFQLLRRTIRKLFGFEVVNGWRDYGVKLLDHISLPGIDLADVECETCVGVVHGCHYFNS